MPSDRCLEIRELTKLDEFGEAVRLQREIWGFHDVELLPRRLFVVANKIGGQVLGAFDGPKMVGFCLCMPGLKPGGKPYLHSQMMGVMPSFRDSGVGKRLKWAQREYALANGVDLIEWTFDPLEIKNAFFNIERLGAIVRRYVHNQYGRTSSHLHGGLPTDRLIAEWWLTSPRVVARSEDRAIEQPRTEFRIAVPRDIGGLRRENPDGARRIQASIASQFDECFSAGLAAIGFQTTGDAGNYLLGQWQ